MLHANQPGKLHRYYYNRHQAHGRDRGAGHPLPKGRAEAGVLAGTAQTHTMLPPGLPTPGHGTLEASSSNSDHICAFLHCISTCNN